LFDVIGGMRFPGVGVDLQGAVIHGQYALIGPVALFRADADGAAGVVIPQTGSTNPLIRPLEGALQAGIAALVQTGDGQMPLDPSRGGALKALVQRTNIIQIFEKGGPIMWPLLFASILALGTALERVLFLMREKWRRDPKALDRFFAAVTQGDIDGAIAIGKASKFYLVRALGEALSHKETALATALQYVQEREVKRFRRGIPILDTVITLAPLLGLLGTVTGMMGSFSLIGGELNAPGAITGGIAEALIATAFGPGHRDHLAAALQLPQQPPRRDAARARGRRGTARAARASAREHGGHVSAREPADDAAGGQPRDDACARRSGACAGSGGRPASAAARRGRAIRSTRPRDSSPTRELVEESPCTPLPAARASGPASRSSR
jgi:biopolymer transport protein ExbB